MLCTYALLVSLLAGPTTPVGVQQQQQNWVPGKRFVESSTKVMEIIKNVSARGRYGYTDDVCLMGAFLTKQGTIEFGLQLRAGEKYAIIGGGDDGVLDLDIQVFDPSGSSKPIAQDVGSDAIPVVEFVARQAGRYTLKVIMANAARNGGFATIGILKENGFTVPVAHLASALANLIAQCEQIDRQAGARNVLFMSGNNQWAVFGTILRQGQTMTIERLTPGSGTRVLVGVGDHVADDLDLFLLDSSGRTLKSDTDPDANPRIVFDSQGGAQFGFRVKNEKSRGLSLVLVAMLDVN